MPEVIIPRLSDTMQEGTITRWLKKAGDEVKKGDILAEVETDKANMEVEAYDAGVLEEILVNEGEAAPIGKPIARIGTGAGVQKQSRQEEAQQSQRKPQEVAQSVQARSSTPAAREPRENSSARAAARPQESGAEARIKVSPLARRMAEEHGIDLQQIQGTGPGGRIVRDDIQDFLEQQRAQPAPAATAPVQAPAAPEAPPPAAPAEEEEVVALTSMQKTIVRRMTESKQNVPHIYIRNEVDMTEALALRQTLNASAGEGGVKISVNDLIIKACALALEKFPEVNTSLKDGPVIRDANIKGVRTIARESRALIEKAQAGKLSVADLSGGTFSISNLGMMDVTDFDAVVNPPEAAILAVGAARKRFVPIDGQPAIRDLMSLTVSADHRIIYGATTARFLQEIKRLLQNPYSLLG